MPALCQMGRCALRAFPVFTCGLVAGAMLCRWSRNITAKRQLAIDRRVPRTIWQPGVN